MNRNSIERQNAGGLCRTCRKGLAAAAAALLMAAVQPGSNVLQAQNGFWQVYDQQNSGIASNSIAALSATSQGVWVGTFQGLARLEGSRWIDYAQFNEKLKGQSINCLMTDQRGVLWVGTDDHGVIEFDGRHWTEYTTETRRLKMKFVKEMVQDKDGTYWIGVTLGGLVSYDGYTWEKYTPDDCELLSDFVLDIAVDRANRKWVTTNEGVSVYNDRNWVNYTVENSGLPSNIVPSVVIDKNNIKWFGTLGGLVRFDGENWSTWNTSNSPLPSNQINDIVVDGEGLLWMATGGGAAVFDGVDRWVVFTSKNSMLPAGNIYTVATDNGGTVWFGSDSKGLARLTGFTMPEKDMTAVSPEASPEKKAAEPAKPLVSDENVRINAYLSDGYITIDFESPVATVVFYNRNGKSVRTVTDYKKGQKIAINRMQKGMYTVGVNTVRGERKIKFNLK